MSGPPLRNPYRENPDRRGRRWIRVARWTSVAALVGLVVFGLVSWRADVREVDDLLLSDTAHVEVGMLSRVDVHEVGRVRSVTTTAVAAGEEYQQTGSEAWACREGEQVRIITHPATDLWFMTTMDGSLSSERRTRDSALAMVVTPASLLVVLGGIFVFNRRMAPRWDEAQARREMIARAHPGVRSRSEMRVLGILPGGGGDDDSLGLPSRGD